MWIRFDGMLHVWSATKPHHGVVKVTHAIPHADPLQIPKFAEIGEHISMGNVLV